MLFHWRYHLLGLSIFWFLLPCQSKIPLTDGEFISSIPIFCLLHKEKKNNINYNNYQNFPGNHLICLTEMADANKLKENFTRLKEADVRTTAGQIPEEALKQHLSKIPQFYKHQSLVFSDLGK
jgi:hypothetical protein